MGLVARDPYAGNLIAPLVPQVLTAIGTAADRVAGGTANAACLRWFGDASAPFRQGLAMALRRFRSLVNTNVITVGFERLKQRNPDTNAGAWPTNVGLAIGAAMAHVPAGREAVELDEAFALLPPYLTTDGAGLIDVTFYNQSRFETLIHELSHSLIGTTDEDWNGHTAYGAKRASRLAAAQPATALENAENWGIFVEACGRNKSS